MQAKTKAHSNHVSIDINIKVKGKFPAGDSLYITGNIEELGSWDPAGLKLSRNPDGGYSLAIAAEKNSIVEFKLTRGDWKTQAICDKKVVPPENVVVKASRSKKINLTIHDWLDRQVLESDPVKGRLMSYNGLACKKLKYHRPIQIWLPDSYSEKGRPCSVIYMHDSQNLFEPATAFAGVDWKVDETISEMLAQKEIRPCIVVGIPNSPDRMKELNLFTPEGKAYAEFVVKEVKPFVESRFNVSSNRHDNAVMGSSMGGLMSLQMLLAYSDVFALAGCLSSAFQKTDGKIFTQIRKATKLPLDSRIYLDTGEFEPPIAESFFEMVELLKTKGYEEDKNLFGFFDSEATHSEAAWARRLHVPLKFLLGKN